MPTVTLVTIKCSGFEIQEVYTNDKLMIRGDDMRFKTLAANLAKALGVELEEMVVSAKLWSATSRIVDADMGKLFDAIRSIELTMQALRNK
jgi:hypothetical protein